MQSASKTTPDKLQRSLPVPLLRLAFRPFFLLAAAFGIASVLVWVMSLTGGLVVNLYGGTYWWHIHEMLFGFGLAVVAGFLLTAVQTWTGIPGIKGKKLAGLVLLWLSARLLMFMPLLVDAWLIALIDLLFIPCLMTVFLWPIVRVSQWRNLVFAPILLAFLLINVLFHWMVLGQDFALLPQVSTTVVLLMCTLIVIIGGRVIPMFTANGTQTYKVPHLPWLDRVTLLSTVLAVVLSFLYERNATELAVVLLAAGLFNLVRALRWRIWVTAKTPLVWSLHLSYWSLALGLILMGLTKFVPFLSFSQALHLVTVGAIGGMILAMIARVSLGHTGRKLVVDKSIAIAFAAIFLSALTRVLGLELVSNVAFVMVTSAVFWSIAFGLFLLRYIPILCSARVDGKPG